MIEWETEQMWLEYFPALKEAEEGKGTGESKASKKPHIMIPAIERHEQIITIPIVYLVDILSGKLMAMLPDGIPADAYPLRVFQDEPTHAICIVVSHPSFPNIEAGLSIPCKNVNVIHPKKSLPQEKDEVVIISSMPQESVDDLLGSREV